MIRLLGVAVALGLSFEARLSAQGAAAPNPLWDPILAALNARAAAGSDNGPSPHTQSVDEDLIPINAAELKAIETAWQTAAIQLKAKTKKAFRSEKNQFFYEKVRDLNVHTFTTLEKAIAGRKKSDKSYRKLAESVLLKVKSNRVASLQNVQNFEKGGQIGFCFGRALLTHFLLLKGGVPQADISKIFTIGELFVGNSLWKFHVAVMVPDNESGYLVVDPMQDGPLPYQDWLEINRNYDIKKPFSRARFYVTEARKFLPSFGPYDQAQLENRVLKVYFRELARTMTGEIE